MPADARAVEAMKVAAVVAAVQAYLALEAGAGQVKSAAIRRWRRDASATGGDEFAGMDRSWTGRN